jgi:hypothetical protein
MKTVLVEFTTNLADEERDRLIRELVAHLRSHNQGWDALVGDVQETRITRVLVDGAAQVV